MRSSHFKQANAFESIHPTKLQQVKLTTPNAALPTLSETPYISNPIRPVSESGETLVPGMGVLICIWGVHHNPRYWGDDVEEFRPERFDQPLTHPVQYIPFSQGPRNCLGFQYAMMSIKTALATVLQQYRVVPHLTHSPSPNSDPSLTDRRPMRVKFDIMMKDMDDFTVQLERRQK